MQKIFSFIIGTAIMGIIACEDYASIRQELAKQTALITATAHAVKHAESSQAMIATLRRFNDEMETLHDSLQNSRKSSSNLKSLMSSPPRPLIDDVRELKNATENLRDILATASMYSEDAHLRKMLVKTAATFEKTLAQ